MKTQKPRTLYLIADSCIFIYLDDIFIYLDDASKLYNTARREGNISRGKNHFHIYKILENISLHTQKSNKTSTQEGKI